MKEVLKHLVCSSTNMIQSFEACALSALMRALACGVAFEGFGALLLLFVCRSKSAPDFELTDYLPAVMRPDSSPIFVEMVVPRVEKAPTTAMATSAAATAYSDNSRPVSSRRKFLIIVLAPLECVVE